MADRDDDQHLLLLSIFHYVAAGLTAFCGCFPWIHVGLGIAMLAGAFENEPEPPPPAVGWVFIGAGGVAILVAWLLAVLLLVAGLSIHRRRRWLFVMVVAAIECVFVPIGTVLGVFTLIVLLRPSVRARFPNQPPATEPA